MSVVETEQKVGFTVRVERNGEMNLNVDSPQQIKIAYITAAFQNLIAKNDTADTSRKSIGKRLKLRIKKAQGNKCAYCGVGEADTIDHVIPCTLGGRSVINNLVASCQTCNVRKGNMLPKEAGMRPKMSAFQLWGGDGYHPGTHIVDSDAWEYVLRDEEETVVPVVQTDEDYHFEVFIVEGWAKEIRIGKNAMRPTPGFLVDMFRRNTVMEALNRDV